MATGTAVLAFGTGKYDVSVAVADASVVAGTKVEAYILVPNTDTPRFRDEYWVEQLQVYAGNIAAGVGFTIYGICRAGSAMGDFTINWVTL